MYEIKMCVHPNPIRKSLGLLDLYFLTIGNEEYHLIRVVIRRVNVNQLSLQKIHLYLKHNKRIS